MITAILFDLFETLVTEAHVRPTARRVLVGQITFAEALADICRSLTGAVDTATVRRVCERRQAQKDAVFARADAGVLDVLRELGRRGTAVGIVSNCFEDDVRAWSASPLASLARCALFSCGEGVAKPDPEIYWRACRRLGSEPGRTAFVGDGGDNELAGAAQAGLRPFRAAWFARIARPADASARVLSDPREVLALAAGAIV